MDYKESNKLIAEFMGVQAQDQKGWFDGYELYKAGLPFAYGAMGNGTDDLKFQSSWDWLMCVVNKISDSTGYELVMRYSHCYWNNLGNQPCWEDGAYMEFYGGFESISTVHEAVVSFIQWHNENKNT